jgi:hypothetical protein
VTAPTFFEEYVASIFSFEEKIKQKTDMKQFANFSGFLLVLFFDPEDGGDMIL